MWDLPGPGLESVSPALAGGFLTTAPPGKSPTSFILNTGFHLRMDSNVVINFTIGEDLNCFSFSSTTDNAVMNRDLWTKGTRTFALPLIKTFKNEWRERVLCGWRRRVGCVCVCMAGSGVG